MAAWNSVWRKVRNVVAPEPLPPEELQEQWDKLHEKVPVPVLWLLGKTQSGKTSLVRALTGTTDAEIGNGFQPCTRFARQYPFPNETECLLRFLDTRGLGEVDYDFTADLEAFANEAHLVVVVMKAMDQAQDVVLQAISQIHQRRPQWPILLVQTCLHEGYEQPSDQHPLPYPFGNIEELDSNPQIPAGLRKALLQQRTWFDSRKIPHRSVAVDITPPAEGYEPANYGLDELWGAIEELFPWGLRGILAQAGEVQELLRDVHYRAAMPHVVSYACAAGLAAGVPIPFVDLPLVIGIQTRMCSEIARIYGQRMNSQRIAEIVGGLGLGFLGRLGTRELFKVIPGLGSTVAALYSAATTYALGVTLCVYFGRLQQGALSGTEEFQKIYAEQFAIGKEKLKTYLEQLRGKSPPQPEVPESEIPEPPTDNPTTQSLPTTTQHPEDR